MNKNFIFSIILLLIIIIGGILIWQLWPVSQNESIFCTQEAKLCPDGSSVGRTGPNCEFAECPVKETGKIANWKTYKNEKYGFEIQYPESEEKYNCYAESGPTPYLFEENNEGLLCVNIAHEFEHIGYLDLGIMVNNEKDSILTECTPLSYVKGGFEGPEKITINDLGFCKSIFDEGGMGSSAKDYFYIINRNNKYIIFSFFVDDDGGCSTCGFLSGPNEKECIANCVDFKEYQGEVEEFLTSILSTLKFTD